MGAPELLTEPGPSDTQAARRRWRRRPLLRAAIRLAAVVAPAIAAVVVAVAFTRLVPVPADLVGVIVWCAAFAVAVLAVWVLSAELLQRTLPLATLLDLALAFPDAAPSRFSILRRRVDPRHVESDLRRLRERSDPESVPRAQLILELAIALSIHDGDTRSHSERVLMYTDLVARELHLRQEDADRLRWAALLHDIGKLAVAPEVLNKPDLPDDDEQESLRSHPLEGYRMIAPLHGWLGTWAATVRDHHERFDGTGYPNGLRGRAISLGGRIVAVTDSYEAMTAGRPYRKPLSARAAREELVRRSGSHFDPYVVRAFLAISLGRLWPAIGIGALISELPFVAPVSWRLSRLGPRSLSGFAAAGATAALIAAGVAGPAAGTLVYGPASRHPQVASASTQPGAAGGPQTAATPSPGSSGTAPAGPGPAAPATNPAASPAASGSPGASPSPGPGPSAGGGSPSYPAGIAKHAVLPAGIAKQANPFAQWRLHH